MLHHILQNSINKPKKGAAIKYNSNLKIVKTNLNKIRYLNQKIAVIKQATDDSLRQLVHENNCVFVTYFSGTCDVCRSLRPSVQILSTQVKNKGIVFIEIDSDENPVAKLEMAEKKLPFIASYKGGLLIDCGTVATEYEIEEMLEKLRKTRRKRPV